MGVTIRYGGKLDDRARLAEMLDAARLYCAEQRWMYRDVDEPITGKVERFAAPGAQMDGGDDGRAGEETSTELIPIDDTLRGMLIFVDPDAEPLWLTLNGAGELAYYMPLNERDEYWQIKTLSFKQPKAGVANHIAVCEFLRYLRDAYFPSLVVYDEANYFESGDPLRAYTAIQEPDTPAL